ncbi:CDP-glycerol glycerophosphotransferase family protein [Nocardioides houyundeii]|uniref:CDP-glycerol glycerophosphotransferase family protein n=1 Tax=Nocardioides houyundeii TaxID=2045452 RepID=UPI000DF19D58|nr:CDP-glycerol glycerophosphotransferase family protein [Nocardioides houyundeii]
MQIVYNSFHGRYSDNPRAVYERLAGRPSLDQLWLADPEHLASFPARTRTVPIDSGEAAAALESADVVIANTHTEVEWTKPESTTYVQTWHGTPLKRIHRDVLWAPEGRLDRLDLDVAKWDLLVSPNPASTPRLRHGFRYDGEVLEIGYPRNDVLQAPDAHLLAARVRKELDIDEDATVVLYAPTWRDDEVFQKGAPEIPLALDLAELSRRLGPDHVVLARLHPLMTGRSPIPSRPGLRDVSLHPDVRDLYLVADVLVTDYSSTMFDFAITGRPMVFFTYDLDRFRDSVRGFYFDLVAEAPGPVVTSGEELVATLRDLPDRSWRYTEFQQTYCSLEDGRATDRLLERLGL